MPDLSGQVIKGYVFRECIGSGGFGAVYRAYQPVVDRDVAIKVILPEHANQPDFIRRFEAEARFVARLEHPHIVPLYDYWRSPEGAYLVMRWLPGSLRDALATGPWGLDATGNVLTQVAGALHVAHRHQVVHRDIKPANILLDEDHNAYLADFGIAKMIDQSTGGTGQGQMIGSLVYTTPEQIKNEPITPQTDLYSLGIVLYELLTGETPFPDATTPTALIYKHLNDPLPSVKRCRPNLPSALDTVIQTATAKDPARRYPDALRMAAAFNALLEAPRRLAAQPLAEQLTRRELEILRLLVDGLSNAEIAERLVLSAGTIKWYLKQIYLKLDVRSREQAIQRAHDLHLTADQLASSLVQAVPDVRPSPALETSPVLEATIAAPENPYKGLRAFQEADAPDFFGREALTARLVERLAEDHPLARFLAVVGPSGSGKSSAVRAGLLPALRRGALPGAEQWFIVEMLPGTHPFEELEGALVRVAARPELSLLSLLPEDERGLARAVRRLLPGDAGEVLLLIDQFEELFTLLDDEPTRIRFLASLRAAVRDPRAHLRVIITLRADFYDRPLRYGAFGELVRERTEVILPLNPDELRQTIVSPAERAGLAVEPALTEVIVAEVSEQPGALPLLQYALTELFERSANHQLTLDTYRAIGGVSGALARRAEEIYTGLSADEQAAARQLFLRLVTLGEGTEDIRRRALQGELRALGDPEAMQGAIDAFDRSRLLSFDHDPVTRGPTVELAHEAILREWSRLRGWLDESRADVRNQRLLAAAVTEWLSAGRDPGYLLTGSRLAQFAHWAERTDLALTDDERAYLEAGTTAAERLEQAERERQAHELETQRRLAEQRQRAANRLRYLVGVLVVATVIATLLSGLAVNRQQAADDAAAGLAMSLTRSEAIRYAAEARAILDTGGDPELGTLLSLRSLGKAYTRQGDTALARALERLHTQRSFMAHTGGLTSLAVGRSGSKLVTGGGDNTVKLWDVASGKLLLTFDHPRSVEAVAFAPDERSVLTGCADGMARLWDAASGSLVQTFSGHEGGIRSVAFSPDGKTILTGSTDKTARLWDAATGRQIWALTGHKNTVSAVAFSPDGSGCATGSGDSTVLLWDTRSGELLRTLTGHRDAVRSVAYSPDGKTLLTGSADKTARLWDANTGACLNVLEGHAGEVRAVAFAPDGQAALTGGADGVLRIWDATSGAVLQAYTGFTQIVSSAAFLPDGSALLSGSGDGSVRLWDPPGSGAQPIFTGHTRAVNAVAFAPDGKTILTGGNDDAARLWDSTTVRQRRVFAVPRGAASVAFAPNGERLAAGGSVLPEVRPGGSRMPTGMMRIWNVTSGDLVGAFRLAQGAGDVKSLAFSPDGQTLLISINSTYSAAYLLNVSNGSLICNFLEPGARYLTGEYTLATPAFSLDGKMVLTASSFGKVVLWDTATGKLITTFTAKPDRATAAAFSPDRQVVALAGEDRIIRLWQVGRWQPVGTLEGHSDTVTSLAFSPDGQILASGSADATTRVWEVPSGKLLRVLEGHTQAITSLAFSPDGSRVVTASQDGTARVWFVNLNTLLNTACARLTRDFTDAERAHYAVDDNTPSCP